MGVQNSPPAPITTAAVTSAFAGAGSPGAESTSCDGGGLNAGAAPARSGGCAARLSRSDTRAWTAAKLWAAPQKAQYATGKPNAMAHAVQRATGDRAAFTACFRNEHAARRTCACGQPSSLLAASAPGPTVRTSRSCLTTRPSCPRRCRPARQTASDVTTTFCDSPAQGIRFFVRNDIATRVYRVTARLEPAHHGDGFSRIDGGNGGIPDVARGAPKTQTRPV